MGMGRVMGIELNYVTDQMRALLSYNGGSGALFTGVQTQNPQRVPPWAYSSEGVEYSFQGRLEFLLHGEWSQFRQFTSPPDQEFGLMVGIAGTAVASERTGSGIEKAKVYGGTADISAMFGGANLFAAFIYEQELDVGRPFRRSIGSPLSCRVASTSIRRRNSSPGTSGVEQRRSSCETPSTIHLETCIRSRRSA